MKAVRYVSANGAHHIGRVEGDRVVDGGPAEDVGFVPTVENWAELGRADGREHALSDVRLLHPVVPGKLIAIGLNYRDHAEESDLEIPPVPVVFAKWTSALIGPDEPIVIPFDETRPDYEGEVALIVSRRVYRATAAEARAAIGGVSAFHDVSGRRAQLETPLRQFTLGKSFDTFAPMGPCIARADDLDLGDLAIRTVVSGETMQDSSTRNLIFSAEDLIVYLSRGMTLEPGDVIATGTPGGVGDSRDPRRYLREGDVVEVTVDGVGTLRNPVTLERQPA
jgi:2-keto-4-pentenoate hydratase/2-oxohepta-3-ene-1,7-dioic acid hydratase in catechol pathway